MHWALFPGLAIFVTVLTINFIGDGLRDALDPRRVMQAVDDPLLEWGPEDPLPQDRRRLAARRRRRRHRHRRRADVVRGRRSGCGKSVTARR